MKVSTLYTITAIVALIFGLGFILAPNPTISLYGNTLEGAGVFMARYFGAAVLGYAFLAWLNRNSASRGLLAGFFAAMVLGFVIALYDAIAGTGNGFLWLNVVIYGLLGIGFGYFSFMKSS